MIKELHEPRDLGRIITGLDQNAWMGIAQAGLIIGVLKITLWVSRASGSSGSLLTINDLDFCYYGWEDFKQFIHDEIGNLNFSPKVNKNKWEEKVKDFGIKREFSYCVCLALLLERHMRNSFGSPSNAQQVAMEEIKKILAGDLEITNPPSGNTGLGDKVDFFVTLHAADLPIIQLNISQNAFLKYSERLEELFAYTIFSVIKTSLTKLNDPYKTLLEDLLFNENLTWQRNLPRVGPPEKWNWLPVFTSF